MNSSNILKLTWCLTQVNFFCTVHCPAGTFAGIKQKSCTYCPRGFYQDRDRQGSCIRCPMGTYTQEEGKYLCRVLFFNLRYIKDTDISDVSDIDMQIWLIYANYG